MARPTAPKWRRPSTIPARSAVNLAGGRRGGGGGRGGQQPGTVVYRGYIEPEEAHRHASLAHARRDHARGQIFINGKLAAKTESFQRAGHVFNDVHAMLKPGKNSIAIVAEGTAGMGRLNQGGGILITPPPPQWKRRVFNGLAQIIVQAGTEAKPITLRARGEGLVETTLEIHAKEAAGRLVWSR